MKEKVSTEADKLKGIMNQNVLDLQLELNKAKKVAADADRERKDHLERIHNIKDRLGHLQFPDTAGIHYEYHDLMDSMLEKSGHL